MSEAMILARGMKKTFSTARGMVRAVDGLDLSIQPGEIYGLVGSDGAGKTTTIRLLVGALRLEAGRVSLAGFDIQAQTQQARASVGYLSQRFSLYEDLSVLENIRFFAEVRGMRPEEWQPRCEEILAFVGLGEFKQRRAGLLSGGMKQKLGLASALVTRPRILLLDEPTTGVDPVTRQDFWQLIIRLAAGSAGEDGVCVLISTPYMDEAARCHRVGFMRQGQLIAEGTPGRLRERLNGRIVELRGSPLPVLRQAAAQDPAVEDVRPFGDRLHLRLKESFEIGELAVRLRRAAEESGALFGDARSIPPTLEDVFIALSAAEDA
jgi:ABC-2 type transport system ATP-binding protein